MNLTIQKLQGTMAKFFCETFPQVNETVEMAKWYKNGIELRNPLPRTILSYTYSDPNKPTGPRSMDGNLLYFSILEPEDEVF